MDRFRNCKIAKKIYPREFRAISIGSETLPGMNLWTTSIVPDTRGPIISRRKSGILLNIFTSKMGMGARRNRLINFSRVPSNLNIPRRAPESEETGVHTNNSKTKR
jgi:hypothetical protein